jgi:hypothetical protein
MGSISDYLENKLALHIFTATGYTPAATVYVGLATADPTDAATGASCNEVSNTGNYSRKAITFSAASARRVTQSADVTFDTLNGSPGTATHWFIADSATYGAGNVLASGAFGASKALGSGDTPSIASGTIYVEFSTGGCSTYLANALLNHAFRNTSYTRPSTYIALTTSTIADSDTGSTIVEPSGNAYARHQVTGWTVTNSVADNTGVESFTAASGSWGTVVATCVVDASSTGNLLTYDNTPADRAVGSGDTWQYAAGAFDNTLS